MYGPGTTLNPLSSGGYRSKEWGRPQGRGEDADESKKKRGGRPGPPEFKVKGTSNTTSRRKIRN